MGKLSSRRGALKLFKRDEFLLDANLSERLITAKLAEYLQPYFPAHNVDPEYNRHGIDPKRVSLPPGCRGGGVKLITPDIVVHQRGHDDENILVIQIKKDTNTESRECDRAIIRALIDEFKYRFGLLIDLPAGAGATKRKPVLEWFE